MKVGAKTGSANRPGVKPHRSVVEGQAKAKAFAMQRRGNIMKLYADVMKDYDSYNRNERPAIKNLDKNDQTYMNSAAGPAIISTLKQIANNRASIARMHALFS